MMTDIDDRMRSLRTKFIAQTLDSITSVEKSVASRDWPSLVATAHSLAGRAGMFGFPGLGDAARTAEEAIGDGATDDVIERLGFEFLAQLRTLRHDL